MKISKIFHFLYFAVLSIPLVSIPIFAIYSQNHEINDNTLQVQENLKVDFNQLVRNTNTYQIGNSNGSNQVQIADLDALRHDNHVYIFSWYQDDNLTSDVRNTPEIYNGITTYRYSTLQNATLNAGSYSWRLTIPLGNQLRISYWYHTTVSVGDVYISNFEFFDLTQMFGEGNEPTIAEFNALFPNSYYEYTESQEMYIENVYTTTYDDTDIMSQFLYCEYNFMDKYLGIYKYQPFSGIYTWIQNTFFNANAPLVFTIFYQWFSYWLLVSLFWLVFDVLIYVPMVAHRWLDKGALE